jgi:hypothetical protein
MLRKKLVSDDTLRRLIKAADDVEARKNAGRRPFQGLTAERITALKAAMDSLDKRDADEVLVFELADEALRKDRYSRVQPGKSDLPVEVQVQKMTGSYYFHLINYIKKELMVEKGLRELDALGLPEQQEAR